jgi:hypothetical protein
MADLTATQQVKAELEFADKEGNVITNPQLDGEPVWETSDATVATVIPDEGGLSALIVAGAPGSGRITAQVDGDLGEGTHMIIMVGDVNVTPGSAAMGTMKFGEPEEQPETPNPV